MKNEMCWLLPESNSSRMILHLREYSHRPWRPYTSYSQYFVPDYKVPGGSKGWATYQKLRQNGWTLISSDRAHISSESVMANSRKN
jgi:hypothetical protein